MPITLGSDGLRLTTQLGHVHLPGAAVDALAGPCSLKVKTTGIAVGQTVPLTPYTADTPFYAYHIGGAMAIGQQPLMANGDVVEGFVGVSQGVEVWPCVVDGTNTVGLVQVDPADGTPPCGIGVSATKIRFYCK